MRFLVLLVSNVDWSITPDCVPSGKHSLRVVCEEPYYALSFNVTTGSSGPLQKKFFSGLGKATSNL